MTACLAPRPEADKSDEMEDLIMNEFKERMAKWSIQEKTIFFGSCLLVLCTLLPWYSVSWTGPAARLMGWGGSGGAGPGNASESWIGLSGWNGWMALILGGALVVLHVAPQVATSIQKPLRDLLPVILAGGAFVLGPLVFLLRVQSAGGAGYSAGPHFFFWIAFLAALAAAGCAAWNKFGNNPAPTES